MIRNKTATFSLLDLITLEFFHSIDAKVDTPRFSMRDTVPFILNRTAKNGANRMIVRRLKLDEYFVDWLFVTDDDVDDLGTFPAATIEELVALILGQLPREHVVQSFDPAIG